jgi:hypothetical protein
MCSNFEKCKINQTSLDFLSIDVQMHLKQT